MTEPGTYQLTGQPTEGSGLDHLARVLRQNGYPTNFICSASPPPKAMDPRSPEEDQEEESRPSLMIPCSCGQVYIGEIMLTALLLRMILVNICCSVVLFAGFCMGVNPAGLFLCSCCRCPINSLIWWCPSFLSIGFSICSACWASAKAYWCAVVFWWLKLFLFAKGTTHSDIECNMTRVTRVCWWRNLKWFDIHIRKLYEGS